MRTNISIIHSGSLSCEPILRRMPDGSLIVLAQVGDVTEPAPGNRVRGFRSEDGGESWSDPFEILPETGSAEYITEVMVLGDVVRAFMTLHSGRFLNMRCVVAESRDCGRTWADAGQPPHFEGFCFIRGMIRLANGDILIPYHHFPVTPEENARLVIASHNIADPLKQRAIWDADVDHIENGVLISRDGGISYERCVGPSIPIKGDTGRGWAWTEPTLAELSDGGVAMLIRVGGTGRLWRSDSRDGGRTWSEARPTDIPNPGNKPKLIALPGGRVALIHTPNDTPGFWHRNPLALWISDDDLRTWSDRRVLSDFPGSFCYADGFYEDERILFTIEYNRHDILLIEHIL